MSRTIALAITTASLALTSCVADTEGLSFPPFLELIPRQVDFGRIPLGAARSTTVVARNTGEHALAIKELIWLLRRDQAFEVAVSGPHSLPAGAETTLVVRYRPQEQGEVMARVRVRPDIEELAWPLERQSILDLSGEGVLDDTPPPPPVGPPNACGDLREEFTQTGSQQVDILFVIDNSNSMSEEQGALAANFRSFIQIAESAHLDYQIGVTTTDVSSAADAARGRLVPLSGGERIVRPSSQPSPAAAFAARANVGIFGSTDEAGLRAAKLALIEPNRSGHNAGFLRDEAALALIFVSDEEDQSLGRVDEYAADLAAVKPDRPLTASAVVGDPGGCEGPGGTAFGGDRYIELTMLTGGLFRSICSEDWATSLAEIGVTSFGLRTRFPLSGTPEPGTLRVFVNGVEVDPGPALDPVWLVDRGSEAVVFSAAHVPPPGAQVVITYRAACP